MIVARFVFRTGWGKSQEVANELKANMTMMRDAFGATGRIRILTDLSGPLNTVVQEMEYENLAEWEKGRAALFANPKFQEMQANSPDNQFESGQVEFYTLEASL